MKALLLAAVLNMSVFAALGIAAGSISATGVYETKKLMTKMDHELLKASSAWKLGDGEPPIGPGKAADLAAAAQKVQFPDFKDAVVKEVALVTSKNGCYYRVMIWQDLDMALEEVGQAGHMKPNQMTFYVLLNSTVINPKIKD